MSETTGITTAPEGALLGGEAVPAEKFRADAPALIAGAASLGELAKDFVFFTPGLLFTHADLDRDPVQEFMNEAEGDPVISLMSFDRPVFDGFRFRDGRTDWNHKLIACERGRWPDLLKFLAAVGIMDTRTKTFYQAMPFSVMVPDPVVMKRSAVLPSPIPMVEVVVIGLNGNVRKVVVHAPSTRPWPRRPPSVVIEKPDEKTVKFAAALFAGQTTGETPDAATAELFAKVQKETA